jgi:hypothetical protein
MGPGHAPPSLHRTSATMEMVYDGVRTGTTLHVVLRALCRAQLGQKDHTQAVIPGVHCILYGEPEYHVKLRFQQYDKTVI